MSGKRVPSPVGTDSNSGNDYHIRRTTMDDGAACLQLHNKHYKDKRTLALWRWLYADYAGSLRDGLHLVAEAGGAVVGTQAMMQFPLAFDGQIVPSMKPEDTLVHVKFWNRDVFVSLFDRLESEFERRGTFALWGFTPVPASFTKIGFVMPTKTKQLVRLFAADAVVALRNGTPTQKMRVIAERAAAFAVSAGASLLSLTAHISLPGLRLALLERAPEAADEISLEFSRRWHAVTLHRSRDYLDWRFFRNPFVRATLIGAFIGEKLIGYAAFALATPKVATLVDLMVSGEGLSDGDTGIVISALLAEAELRAVRMGASAIRGWSVTEHPFDRLVRRTARRRGWLYIRKGHDVAVRILEPYKNHIGELNIDDWYITRAATMGELG